MMIVSWGSVYWSCENSLGINRCRSGNWVPSVSRSFYDSIETIVVISSIVDGSDCTIGFSQAIRTFDYITITYFMLGFVVTSVPVLNSIIKFILGVRLEQNRGKTIISLVSNEI